MGKEKFCKNCGKVIIGTVIIVNTGIVLFCSNCGMREVPDLPPREDRQILLPGNLEIVVTDSGTSVAAMRFPTGYRL